MEHLCVVAMLATSSPAPADHDWQSVLHSPDQTLTLVDRSMSRRLEGGRMMVWLKEDYSGTQTPSRGTRIRKVRYDCVQRTRRFIASSSFSATGRLTAVLNVAETDQKDVAIAPGSDEDLILKKVCI